MGKLKAISLCLVCTIFLSVNLTYNLGAQTLKIAIFSADLKPYKWTENQKSIGPLLDVTTQAADRAGIELVLDILPIKRIFLMLENGSCDGVVGLTRTAEREVFCHYLDTPVGWAGFHLFVKKGNEFPFETIADLYGKTVGGITGVHLGKEFGAAVKAGKVKMDEVKDIEILLLKLEYGRNMVVGAPTAVFQYLVNKKGLQNKITILPRPIRPYQAIHMLFSKKTNTPGKEQLMEKMGKALKEMEKDKTFEKIYGSYGYAYKLE